MALKVVNRKLRLLIALMTTAFFMLLVTAILFHLPDHYYVSEELKSLRPLQLITGYNTGVFEDKVLFSDFAVGSSPVVNDRKTGEHRVGNSSSNQDYIRFVKKKNVSKTQSISDTKQKLNATGYIKSKNENTTMNQQKLEDTIMERFNERKVFLKKQCDGYGDDFPFSVKMILSDAFYYSRKYDLVACVSAKGGASTWKTHFLHMNGHGKYIRNPHEPHLQHEIKATVVIGKQQLFKKLYEGSGQTRIISVREPFARLLSAYTNKFRNGLPTIPGKNRSRYFQGPVRLMGMTFSPSIKVSVPFWAFLRNVVLERSRGFGAMNRHWRPYSSVCRPCHVYYDFILKLETFTEDIQYLIRRLGIEEISVRTQRNKSTKGKATPYLEYFRNVSDDTIREVFEVYKEDFRLFSYEVPQFVQDVLAKAK